MGERRCICLFVIEYDHKYYWFVSVSHAFKNGKAIGVAVSTSPMGPFEDAIGEPLVTHDVLPVSKSEKANLDPSVLIDDDGKAYIFWGNGICYFAGLSESLTNIKARYTQSIFLILRKEVIFINAMDGITFLMAMIYLRR